MEQPAKLSSSKIGVLVRVQVFPQKIRRCSKVGQCDGLKIQRLWFDSTCFHIIVLIGEECFEEKEKESQRNSKSVMYYQLIGSLVQLVRTLPCHGRSHGFEFHTDRKFKFQGSFAQWQLQLTVTQPTSVFVGSSPSAPTKTMQIQHSDQCSWLPTRGREFESHYLLQLLSLSIMVVHLFLVQRMVVRTHQG